MMKPIPSLHISLWAGIGIGLRREEKENNKGYINLVGHEVANIVAVRQGYDGVQGESWFSTMLLKMGQKRFSMTQRTIHFALALF